MKTFNRIFWSLCAAGVLISPASAQKVGSTSMQFLKVMPCARATALGDAYSVLAAGAEALFWNPSGLALVNIQEVSFTYTDWIFDTRQGALSYALPLGDMGGIGLQLLYADFGEFEETSLAAPYIKNPTAPGMTGRTFHPFSYLVGITYARNLTDRFSVGVSAKYAHESLFNGQQATAMVSQGVYEEVNTWGNGFLFDLGIRYNTGFRSMEIAASVQNFGGNVQFGKESNPVPLQFRFGIAADLLGKDGLLFTGEQNRLGVAFDLFQPNDYDQQEHVGLEYEFDGTFALRAGYKFNYDYEGLTLGAGVRQTLGALRLALDYSYGSIGPYLGTVQRISLGVGLE